MLPDKTSVGFAECTVSLKFNTSDDSEAAAYRLSQETQQEERTQGLPRLRASDERFRAIHKQVAWIHTIIVKSHTI